MKTEEQIREKLRSFARIAPDEEKKAVNRGALYGWVEALEWVLEEVKE